MGKLKVRSKELKSILVEMMMKVRMGSEQRSASEGTTVQGENRSKRSLIWSSRTVGTIVQRLPLKIIEKNRAIIRPIARERLVTYFKD